ncbi:hypothetical protein ACUODJ_46355, partial [Escherichia sp. HC-CC]
TIILQKYQSYGTCPITGEISPQNIKIARFPMSTSDVTHLQKQIEEKKKQLRQLIKAYGKWMSLVEL